MLTHSLTNLQELSALHTKRLLVNFETDESQQEIDIDNKENEIKGLLRHAEGLVKKIFKVMPTATNSFTIYSLTYSLIQANDTKLTPAEQKVRENMQRSFSKKLQNLTMQYRTTQVLPYRLPS